MPEIQISFTITEELIEYMIRKYIAGEDVVVGYALTPPGSPETQLPEEREWRGMEPGARIDWYTNNWKLSVRVANKLAVRNDIPPSQILRMGEQDMVRRIRGVGTGSAREILQKTRYLR